MKDGPGRKSILSRGTECAGTWGGEGRGLVALLKNLAFTFADVVWGEFWPLRGHGGWSVMSGSSAVAVPGQPKLQLSVAVRSEENWMGATARKDLMGDLDLPTHPALMRRLRPWSHWQELGSRILGPSLQGARRCVVSACVGMRVCLHWRALRVRRRGIVDLTTYRIQHLIHFSLCRKWQEANQKIQELQASQEARADQEQKVKVRCCVSAPGLGVVGIAVVVLALLPPGGVCDLGCAHRHLGTVAACVYALFILIISSRARTVLDARATTVNSEHISVPKKFTF